MVHSKLAREEVDQLEGCVEPPEPVTMVDTTKLVQLDDDAPFDPTRDVTKQFTLESLAAIDGLDWDPHECSTMPGEESYPVAVERDGKIPPAAGAEMPQSPDSSTDLRPHLAPASEDHDARREPRSDVRRVRRPSATPSQGRVRVVVRPWRRLVVVLRRSPKAMGAATLADSTSALPATEPGVRATTVTIAPETEGFGIVAVAKWLAISAVLLGAVLGGARLEHARSMASASALGPAPVSTVVETAPSQAPVVEPETMASAEAPSASPPPPPPLPTPSASASPVASAPPELRPMTGSRHLGPIERAKQSLAAGNPAGALRQVDDYDRFYRRGPLAPESTSVRVEALLQEGNQDAAFHLADRFLAVSPKGPYAAHIRLLVEQARTP